MMDLKKDLVKPIATGVAVLLLAFIIAWIFGAIGLPPFHAIAVNVTAPGIVGLLAVCWGVGYAVPRIPQFVDNVLKNL
ncbi:MAG: hypothetical protein QXF26_09210 [Candidatus Bathyarchaeia archaeon]